MKRGALSLAVGTLSLAASVAFGQLPGIKNPIKLPSVEEMLFKDEPALTSSLKDVKFFGVQNLDGWVPINPTSLIGKERDSRGAWVLDEGQYDGWIHSFCCRSASYGPSKGMGYVDGPWKGSKAKVLNDLAHRYSMSTNVDQRDFQLLVWAIIARAKPEDWQGGAKVAADKLFTKKDWEAFSKGALDGLAQEALAPMMRKVDNALRPAYEAENQVRSMVTKLNSPFEDIERLMVLAAPPELDSSVSAGRWMWSPYGYAMRYMPQGYSKTHLQIAVPHARKFDLDDKGRVTRLECPPGYISEYRYDDSKQPAACPDDAKLMAHALSNVKITVQQGGLPRSVEFSPQGFVFVGNPSKPSQRRTTGEDLFAGLFATPAQGWFSGWQPRLERAYDAYNTYAEWVARYEDWKKDKELKLIVGKPDGTDFFRMEHTLRALETYALANGKDADFVKEFMSKHCEAMLDALRQANQVPDKTVANPHLALMMPANVGSQRLMPSSKLFEN